MNDPQVAGGKRENRESRWREREIEGERDRDENTKEHESLLMQRKK